MNSIILGHNAIEHKIRRIAFQIYESNVNESKVIIAGIDSNGYLLAEKLRDILKHISDIEPILCKVTVNKQKPWHPISTCLTPEEYTNASIVLVDDVLNSGTTLIYGVKHFLNVPLKQFKTAVLVNRNHKKYPVKADFKGISLSTSLQEHVSVNFSENNYSVVLE
jgi:pyrimidine operon attenuation protein/uracil phosphoribosyltransferase